MNKDLIDWWQQLVEDTLAAKDRVSLIKVLVGAEEDLRHKLGYNCYSAEEYSKLSKILEIQCMLYNKPQTQQTQEAIQNCRNQLASIRNTEDSFECLLKTLETQPFADQNPLLEKIFEKPLLTPEKPSEFFSQFKSKYS